MATAPRERANKRFMAIHGGITRKQWAKQKKEIRLAKLKAKN
jgi:hypothetical protein